MSVSIRYIVNNFYINLKRINMRRFLFTTLAALCLVNSTLAQNWTEIYKASNPEATADTRFGTSVAIDGNYAVIGASADNYDASNSNPLDEAGSVFIFKRATTGTWSFITKLTADDREAYDNFGASVAIYGSTIAIGAPFEGSDESNVVVANSGSVYIYDLTGDDWTFTKKLKASDREVGDNFGTSVALYNKTLIVGATNEDHSSTGTAMMNNSGSAYIFELVADWVETAKITASDRTINDRFGDAVAIHGDNIIVGTRFSGKDLSGANLIAFAGSVYAFKKDVSGNWIFNHKIVAPTRVETTWFGAEVSMTNTHAIISAWGDNFDALDQNEIVDAGAAYIYELQTDGTWLFKQKVVSDNRIENDHFAYSVGISGNNAVIGSRFEGTPDAAGVAYFLQYDGASNWDLVLKTPASDATESAAFGTAAAISNDFAIIGDNFLGAYIFEITPCVPATSMDVIASCEPIQWLDGLTYAASNSTATHTIVGGAQNGCDSIITLNFTLLPALDVTVNVNWGEFTANQTGVSYQWIDCDNSNAPISGATNQMYIPTANGNYAVILTATGCTDTSACIAMTTVGIESVDLDQLIQIFPNPSEGNFTINLFDQSSITILDLSGRHLLHLQGKEGNNNINLVQQAGVYLVHIQQGDQQLTRRITIK